MKKLLVIAAIAAFTTSCKKDYTCSCTVTSDDPSYKATTTTGKTGKMKKKDAQSKCDEGDKSYTVPSYDANFNMVTYTYKVACDIK